MNKNNKIQQNKKRLVEAMEKSLGVVTTACKLAGLDRSTFYKYYNDDPEFKNEVDNIENIVLDFVESQLHKQIKEGNTSSTIFFLKTKGKKRGYIERREDYIDLRGSLENHNVDLNALESNDLEKLLEIKKKLGE